jgi:cold shock CspA family protein
VIRIHGTLKKWNDERGFGFIESPSQEKEIFVHISAFPHEGGRPKVGETISFEIRTGPDGKVQAVAIQRSGTTASPRQSVRRSPTSRKPSNIAIVPVLLILGLVGYVDYRFLGSPQFSVFDIPSRSIDSSIQAETQNFKCDGRQYCSEMRSRAEAEFFIRNCPNTKMDGDHDGVPCENDSRF